MNNVNVLAPGAEVAIGDSIPGRIKAVNLKGAGGKAFVQYQVGWFDGRSYRENWFARDELILTSTRTKTVKIGFQTDGE